MALFVLTHDTSVLTSSYVTLTDEEYLSMTAEHRRGMNKCYVVCLYLWWKCIECTTIYLPPIFLFIWNSFFFTSLNGTENFSFWKKIHKHWYIILLWTHTWFHLCWKIFKFIFCQLLFHIQDPLPCLDVKKLLNSNNKRITWSVLKNRRILITHSLD